MREPIKAFDVFIAIECDGRYLEYLPDDDGEWAHIEEVRALEKHTTDLERKLKIAEEALMSIKEELQTFPISSVAKERSMGRCEYTALEALSAIKEEK